MGKYFTIEELTNSDIAKKHNISNTPNQFLLNNLNKLIDNILDPLREAYGKPIIVNSGFRSQQLNDEVNGSKSSQHCKGEAADIRAIKQEDNELLFKLLQKLPFDQLIDEHNYSWVHVSYSNRNRRLILHI